MSRIKQFKCFSVKLLLYFLKQPFIFTANSHLFAYFLLNTQPIIQSLTFLAHKKAAQWLLLYHSIQLKFFLNLPSNDELHHIRVQKL